MTNPVFDESAAQQRTIDGNTNLSAETELAELLSGSVYMPAPVRRNVNFSGSDVEAYIMAYGSLSKETFIPLINLAAISISIHRDKSPVRRLGESAAKAYTKGTRTVAGSIVLVNFDRAGFYELIASQLMPNSKDPKYFSAVYGDTGALGGQIGFADDIPPFDIMLLFKEERSFSEKGFRGGNLGPLSGRPVGGGKDGPPKRIVSKMMIKEVHLVDEGVVTGTDEAYLETTFQYVAEDLEYLRPTDDPKLTAPAKIETPPTATVKVEPAIPYRLFGHENAKESHVYDTQYADNEFVNDQRVAEFTKEEITEEVNLLFWGNIPETFTGTFGGDYATEHVDASDKLLGAITRIPGTCSEGDTTSTNQKDCEDADEGGGAGTWTETVELLNGKVANYVGDPAAAPQVQPSIPSEPWKASNVYIRPLDPVPPYFDDPARLTTLKDFTISAKPSDKWIVEDGILNKFGKYKIQSGDNENSEVFYDNAATTPFLPGGLAGAGSGYDYVQSDDGSGTVEDEIIDGERARFLILKNAYLNDPASLRATAGLFGPGSGLPGEGGEIENESHWEVNKFGVHEFFNIGGPKYIYKTECTDSAVCNFGAPKYGLNLGLGKYYFELDSIPISASVLGDPLSDYIEASSPIGKHLIEKVAAVDPADDFVYKDDPVTADNLVRVTLGGSDSNYMQDADILQTANTTLSYAVMRLPDSVTVSTLSGTCTGQSADTEITCLQAEGTWAPGTVDGVGAVTAPATTLMYFDLSTSLSPQAKAMGPLMTAQWYGDDSPTSAQAQETISVQLEDWSTTGTPISMDITENIASFVHNGWEGATGSKKDNSKIGINVPGLRVSNVTQSKHRDLPGGSIDNFVLDDADDASFDIVTEVQEMSISIDNVTIDNQSGAQTGVYANLVVTGHDQDFGAGTTTFTVEGFEDNITGQEEVSNVASGYGPPEVQAAIPMTGQLVPGGTVVNFPAGADPHGAITEIIAATFTDQIIDDFIAAPLASYQISNLASAPIDYTAGETSVTISGLHDPISTNSDAVHTVTLDQTAWNLVGAQGDKIRFDMKSGDGNTNVADHYDYFVGELFGDGKAYIAHYNFSACEGDLTITSHAACEAAGVCSVSTYNNDEALCLQTGNTWVSANNDWVTYPEVTFAHKEKRSITALSDNSGIEIDLSDLREKITNLGAQSLTLFFSYDFKYTEAALVNMSYKQHVNASGTPSNTFDHEVTLNPILNPDVFANYTLVTNPASVAGQVTVSGVTWDTVDIDQGSNFGVADWKFNIKNIPLLDEPHDIVINYVYKWTSASTNNIPVAAHYLMYNFNPALPSETEVEIDFGIYQPLYLDANGAYQNWDWSEIKDLPNWTDYLEVKCKDSQLRLDVENVAGADGTSPGITVTLPTLDNGSYKCKVINIPLGVLEDPDSWLDNFWDGILGTEDAPQGNLKITVNGHYKNTSGRDIIIEFQRISRSQPWEYANTAPHNLGVNLLWDDLGNMSSPFTYKFDYKTQLGIEDTIAISPQVAYNDSVGVWKLHPSYVDKNIRQITITNLGSFPAHWSDLQGADIANVQIFDGSNYSNSPLDDLRLEIQHVPMISDTIDFDIQFTYMLDPLQLTLKYLSDSGSYWNDMPINGTFAIETEVPVLVTPKVTRDGNGAVTDSTGSFSYNLDIIKSVDFVSVDGNTRKDGILLQPFNEGLVDAHDGAWCRADISNFSTTPSGATSNLEDKDGTELRQLVYRSGLDPILSTDADTLYGLEYSHYANVTSTSTDAYKLEVTYEYITEYEPALLYTKPGYVMTARINAENVDWAPALDAKWQKDWELAIDIPTKTIYLNDGEYWQAGYCTNVQYDPQDDGLTELIKSECLTQAEYCSDSQWSTQAECADAGECTDSQHNNDQTACEGDTDCNGGGTTCVWTSADNIWYGKNTWNYPEIDELVCKSLEGEWKRDPSGMYTPPGNINNEDLEVSKGQCTVNLDLLAEKHKLIMWGFWLIREHSDETGFKTIFVNPERYSTMNTAIAEMQLEYQKKFGPAQTAFCADEIRNDLGELVRFTIKKTITDSNECEDKGFNWYFD